MASFIQAEIGVRFRGAGIHWHNFDEAVRGCLIRDLLDMITLVDRYFRQRGANQIRAQWVDAIRRIFAEENLAYSIDNLGGIHPAVDQEFQQNREVTIAGLQLSRYANARTSFETVSTRLLEDPPNYKDAWRAIFAALEGLFRLMFPNSPRLTADEIEGRLRPIMPRIYVEDAVALRATNRLIDAFKNWVEASHNYRHEPGVEEPHQPPADIAILAISDGTSLLRWLIGIDSAMQLAT